MSSMNSSRETGSAPPDLLQDVCAIIINIRKIAAIILFIMRQYIRKADVILLIVLVAIGLAATAVLGMQRGNAGAAAKVVIKSGGSVYATYPLGEDRTVVVPAPKQIASDGPSPDPNAEASAQYDYYNVVIISEGAVCVSEATCKNKVCMRHSSISHPGESIVCLPNRLVVSIESEEGGGYDSITS